MSKQEKLEINTAIGKMLELKLKSLVNEQNLTKILCVQIYEKIFESLSDVFTNSNISITNESMNFVAQMYYDLVKINSNQELDPNIFSEKAKLENIETKELVLLYTMFRGTELCIPFYSEIKRRN